MPDRDYQEWNMTPETRGKLADAMNRGAYGNLPPPNNVRAARDTVGRDALIQSLAGTSDKKSRAWKTARDNVQRWASGQRSPSKANRAKISGAMQAFRRSRISESGTANVTLTARFEMSKDKWQGKARASLSGKDLQDFIAALHNEDHEGAAQIIADDYGLDPQYVAGLDDVFGVDIDTE